MIKHDKKVYKSYVKNLNNIDHEIPKTKYPTEKEDPMYFVEHIISKDLISEMIK